jgi:anaerobic selenocysteine-containing dehydrogenase
MHFHEACFADDIDALIDQALTTDHPHFAGITRARLEAEGHVPLNLPTNADGESLPFANAEWFATPSGRGELTPVPIFIPNTESRRSPDAATYPLEFLPRKADNYMNSTFANIPRHQRMESHTTGLLEIHPTDAAVRRLANGDSVEVFNARGTITLRAHIADTVPPGVVAARLDWNKLSAAGTAGTSNVNALTSERLTDIGAAATFYSTLVQVRQSRPAN